MKPFLGIDVTEDQASDIVNGEEFIVSRLHADDPIAEEVKNEAEPEKYKSPVPLYLRIIRFCFGLGTMLFVIFVLRVAMKSSGHVYLEAYLRFRPWIFWLGGGSFLCWLGLSIYESILESRAKKASEAEKEKDEDGEDEVIEIPEDALSVDLLLFSYTEKDGKTVAVSREDAIATYINGSMSLYSDGESLFIASLDEKYAIPLSSLRAIHTVNERIAIPDWNKDVAPTKGEYKPYKLSVDNLDRITLSTYHILEFDHKDEKWGIYFPCYELPAIESLTGLKA